MTDYSSNPDTIKSKVQDLGHDAADAVRSKATEAVETAQSRAVSEASSIANAADAAGDEFRSGSLQAQLADQVAAGAEHVAKSIADVDVNALTRDVSDFARRNPLIFIGGAALAGMALARFLKARDPSPLAQTYSDDDPWKSRSENFNVPS